MQLLIAYIVDHVGRLSRFVYFKEWKKASGELDMIIEVVKGLKERVDSNVKQKEKENDGS